MKTAVLGDTHGRNLWKQVNVDQIIFLGDYFDSFDIGFSDQINNFYDIIEYKKHRKDEVILLLGNHDYHYGMVERMIEGIGYVGCGGRTPSGDPYSGIMVEGFELRYEMDRNNCKLF